MDATWKNNSFMVGRARVTCVDELTIPGLPYAEMLSPFDQNTFEARRDEMPEGYSRDNNGMLMKVQNWLLQVDGRNILIDSGFGNGKSLPGLPPEFSHLDTAFLGNLLAAGVSPEDVDLVLHTHVHVDHIGWNTQWDGHQWVPTFTKARHVLTEVERQYWDTTSVHYNPAELSQNTMENCFEESMLPVIREGMVDVAGVDAQIDGMLRYVAAPGHTPGQAAIRFECDGEGILFAGDSLHHVLQVALPEWSIVWDEDYDLAVRSRKRILEMCAQDHLILAPAHFARQACRVSRQGSGYRATNIAMADAEAG